MFGLICGLLICYQPAPAPGPPGPSGDRIGLIVNDSPVEVRKATGEAAGRTWYWRDQDCHPTRPTSARCYGSCERTWAAGSINGSSVDLWGWYENGAFRWRWDEQRSHYQRTGAVVEPKGDRSPTATPAPLEVGDLPIGDPRPTDAKASTADPSKPVESGVVLPSGFEPKADPKTGALLMGVDPKGLAKDGEQVRASDPETKAEGEDVRKFYEMAPDSTAKAVARNLPPIISPNTWAAVFGYDLPTALTRLGGVGLLGGAAFLVHRRRQGLA